MAFRHGAVLWMVRAPRSPAECSSSIPATAETAECRAMSCLRSLSMGSKEHDGFNGRKSSKRVRQRPSFYTTSASPAICRPGTPPAVLDRRYSEHAKEIGRNRQSFRGRDDSPVNSLNDHRHPVVVQRICSIARRMIVLIPIGIRRNRSRNLNPDSHRIRLNDLKLRLPACGTSRILRNFGPCVLTPRRRFVQGAGFNQQRILTQCDSGR